jgi:hypothetical protein
MGKSADSSTAVYPRIQARRITAVQQAEYLARSRRDGALLSVDIAPETLALIGGPSCHSVKDATAVALWLWMVAENTNYNSAAAALQLKVEGDLGGYSAAAAGGVVLARQMMAAVMALVNKKEPLTDLNTLAAKRQKLAARWAAIQKLRKANDRAATDDETAETVEPARLGSFWASMIEGAGLSESFSKIYLAHQKGIVIPDQVLKEGTAVLHNANRTLEAQDPDEPETDETQDLT